jgi:hypothetical protein
MLNGLIAAGSCCIASASHHIQNMGFWVMALLPFAQDGWLRHWKAASCP